MATTPSPRTWLPAFAVLALVWGNSFLFIKVAVADLHPFQLTLIRVVVGALTMLAIILVTRDRLPRGWKLWGHFFAASTVMSTIPFTLFGYGETQVSSVLAAIWNATTPLCTLLFTLVLLKGERPSAGRIGGLVLGFLGVMVVLGVWRPMAGGAIMGSLACFIAAASYGLGGVYMRKFLSDRPESGVALSFGQLVAATAQILVIAPIMGVSPVPTQAVEPKAWASVLALGALGTGLAYMLMYRTVRIVGVTTMSTVTYLLPVVAGVTGVALLGEHISWNQPVGALVVLAAIALTQGRFTKKRAESPVAAGVD
ncbi:transporter [Actinorhabdospora filicis]|uniref:Transporter n=1 Tax=Actinorhabdospora filicis TaxID=1785913 RepID=A0A9W6SJU2_9ACTN|nr:DMT family transporter [Actinorhabdospora filicis]GLZ76929.1 transporter [Actinorhabdospora filicis]